MSDIISSPGPSRRGPAATLKSKVLGGGRNAFGLVCGNRDQFWLTEIIVGGLLRIASPGGKKGPPYIYTLPAYTELGSAIIDGTSTKPIKFDMLAGVDYCAIRKVTFSGFTAQPPASFRGGIYTADAPASGPPVAASMILSDQTSYNELAPGEFSAVLKEVPPEIHRPPFFLWMPGAPSAVPLRFKVSIEGMAYFKQNGVIVPP